MTTGTASGPSAAPAGGTGPVAGVLLAAGTSSRMGRNKLLLELDGEPLVRRAARTALAAGLAPVLVVVGHEAALTSAALEGLPCQVVHHAGHLAGQGSSLAAGLAALPAGAAAAVVLLADMPLVTPDLVVALLEAYRRSGARLVLAEYAGVLAPPALYDRALFAELCSPGDQPGKRVVAAHRAEALTVPFPAAALADVDAPGDLARLAALPRSTP